MAFEARESGGAGGPIATARIGVVEARAAAPSRFLGPRMVALAAFANFLSSAITFGAFGNFLAPLADAFGVPRSTIGYGASFTIVAMGLAAPFAGRWLDDGRARPMMAAGAAWTGVGLLALSQAGALWQAAVAYLGFVCLGAAFFGSIPSMALTTNWYARRRGLALGFTVAGGTLATYAAPTSAQALIDAFGWRTAAAAFGAWTLLVAVPLFGLFVIGRPERVGQRPDGDAVERESDRRERASAAAEASAAPLVAVRETSELARDPRLWLLAVGFGLVMTSPIVLMPLLIEFGRDLGFDEQETALFYATMIPFSLLGKLVVGGLADVAPLKPSLLMIVVVNMLVWAIFHAEPGYALFLATGAIYGIGIGGAAPVQGVAVARCFGRANFGRANALGAIVAIPLLTGASVLSHWLDGMTGSYAIGFLVQIGLVGAGGVAIALVRFPSREEEPG
ncbi:MAG: MFS transporter [Myxococcota bacterium]